MKKKIFNFSEMGHDQKNKILHSGDRDENDWTYSKG